MGQGDGQDLGTRRRCAVAAQREQQGEKQHSMRAKGDCARHDTVSPVPKILRRHIGFQHMRAGAAPRVGGCTAPTPPAVPAKKRDTSPVPSTAYVIAPRIMKPERVFTVPSARAFGMTNEETMAADSEDIFGRAIRKLERLAHLDETDRQAIRALHARIETYPAHSVLVKDGARVTHCTLLIDGFACSQKDMSDGGRQILSFHLAGDLVDLSNLLLNHSDHAVQALTPATIARISAQDLRRLAEARPRIAEALWRDTLIEAAIAREWVVNVGRRSAMARIAHLICEFATRREAAGFGPPERFDLPMTQEQIGDATGLTSVHVNRKLHDLQEIGVIARERRDLHIRDWPQLIRIGDFDPTYLHAAP